MICPNCSSAIDNDAVYCPVCGYAAAGPADGAGLPWYGDPPGSANPYPGYMVQLPPVPPQPPVFPGQAVSPAQAADAQTGPVYSPAQPAAAYPAPPVYPGQAVPPAQAADAHTGQLPSRPAAYMPPVYPGPGVPPAPYPYPVRAVPRPPKPGNKERNWYSIAGMICGILSLPCVISPFAGIIVGATGFGFSLRGMPSQRRGMSIAGIACGAVGFVIGTIAAIAALASVSWLGGA